MGNKFYPCCNNDVDFGSKIEDLMYDYQENN